MQHVWSVLCTQPIIDQDTNNLSLMNVTERLVVAAPPPPGPEPALLPIQLSLVSLWNRTDIETGEVIETRFALQTPNGVVVVEGHAKVDLSHHVRGRSIRRFPGVPLTVPGYYRFSVSCQDGADWQEVASIPLEVVFEAP